ncbi:MAG: hypothetical protein NZN45_01445, partial [Rhodovarius sp.]|nr:hypothetical protein [Rhodovarius sp.]
MSLDQGGLLFSQLHLVSGIVVVVVGLACVVAWAVRGVPAVSGGCAVRGLGGGARWVVCGLVSGVVV